MKTENTFIANISVGAKEGYDGWVHDYDEIKELCQRYCNDVSFCVTITETEFIYKNGNERGFIIGIINYPRFPSTPKQLTKQAIAIAKILGKKLNQERVSVICSDKTYTIEKSEYA
jgi:6-pyruvoyl-tetrahydropterin synthase